MVVFEFLNVFFIEIISFLLSLVVVLIWLGIVWLIVSLVRLMVSRGLKIFGLDECLN